MMGKDKNQYSPTPTHHCPLISIIIPARNDAKAVGLTLDYLQQLNGIADVEILIGASGRAEETERAVAGRARLDPIFSPRRFSASPGSVRANTASMQRPKNHWWSLRASILRIPMESAHD